MEFDRRDHFESEPLHEAVAWQENWGYRKKLAYDNADLMNLPVKSAASEADEEIVSI